MRAFEVVSDYKDKHVNLPQRKTAKSAGYDFEVAEDMVIYPYDELCGRMALNYNGVFKIMDLSEVAAVTKQLKTKPSLVPTGIKCKLEDDEYLELSVRSSCPLKHWLILANGVGIIDADYYNNPDNEGHIYFQIINLSPFPIQLRKGDVIGQGIIRKYYKVDGDEVQTLREGGFGSTSNASQEVLQSAT